MQLTIAVLGTGRMGAAIATRLLDSGHRVTVWNRTSARTVGPVEAGARAAATPADAVRDADVVITMLTDGTAVETVLFGPSGAAAALASHTPVVEMSTIGPARVHDLARRLPSGVSLVDAPVGGSVPAVEKGELLILAGGDAATIDHVSPVLAALGTVRRCGALGAGAAAKLVLNTALVTGMAALADAYAVGEAVGMDRATATEILGSSALAAAVARASGGGAFTVALAAKDLSLAIDALGSAASAPLAAAAARVLAEVSDQSAELTSIATNVIATKE
jgi:3-hydroxyisobutyrate dehydrogenase-like beta-hydroxyacid dehydrogenase